MRHTRYKPCPKCESQEFRHVVVKKNIAIIRTGSIGHGSEDIIMEAFECNRCGHHIATNGFESALQEEVKVTKLPGQCEVMVHYDQPL